MKFAQTHAFANTGAFRNHYREQHEHKLEIRQAGPNRRYLQDDLVRRYSLFAGRISHNWSPRKAKHRDFSPELGDRPSIQSLLPTGPPTPLYGPGAPVRATSSRRPRRNQEVENQGYDSATDFEGFQDDDADRESATAAKPDAAPLHTEVRGESSPSELRAARRGKQKATKRGDAQSRISKPSRKGERSVSGNGPRQQQQQQQQQERPARERRHQHEGNAHSKNAREVFDKDIVVPPPRGLAHQVILFEAQSLNQATITQILAEGQATNAHGCNGNSHGAEGDHETNKRQKKVPMAERHCFYCQRKGHYASACPKREEDENKLRSQGRNSPRNFKILSRFTALEQRLSTAEKKADAVAAAAATEKKKAEMKAETMWSYMTEISKGKEEKTKEVKGYENIGPAYKVSK
ncbi:hypothetical protein FCOIX_7601 [Fusarium coicis]|nr:hypothetical protein FCOIX_7601 [Fusarium coicis]